MKPTHLFCWATGLALGGLLGKPALTAVAQSGQVLVNKPLADSLYREPYRRRYHC